MHAGYQMLFLFMHNFGVTRAGFAFASALKNLTVQTKIRKTILWWPTCESFANEQLIYLYKLYM